LDDVQPDALLASARNVSIAAELSRLVSSSIERWNGASLYIRWAIGARHLFWPICGDGNSSGYLKANLAELDI